MKKEALIYGLVGLLLGGLLVGLTASYAVNNNSQSMMKMMGMSMNMDSQDSMTMDDMASSLKNKTGDDFDKAFIKSMIEHHQGAIDMANLAKTNAKHDEIKQMADDIISAQSKEIDMMKTWQSEWGYSNGSSADMMHTEN